MSQILCKSHLPDPPVPLCSEEELPPEFKLFLPIQQKA